MEAFGAAWEASSHTPFDLGHGEFEHANWPAGVAPPGRPEVRALVHRGLLEVDDSVTPIWRVFPSALGHEMAGIEEESALADPDRRLGLILEATVTAFEMDPSQPLQLDAMQQADLVRHTHWPLEPKL